MKKKLLTAVLAVAIVTAFTACNNAADETKKVSKEKMPDGDNHKKNDADTLGMKMGGNELDSKKK